MGFCLRLLLITGAGRGRGQAQAWTLLYQEKGPKISLFLLLLCMAPRYLGAWGSEQEDGNANWAGSGPGA